MNIAGFILMCLFAAFSFWLAHVSRKPKTHGFEGCPTALATVSHTESREDRDGDYRGYAYVVEFLDVEGRETVGKSETFSCKRTSVGFIIFGCVLVVLGVIIFSK